MRESLGNTYILWIVAFFVAIVMLFFVASFNYTRAFKVKNRIINIIETNGEYNDGTVKNEINSSLNDMAYRIDPNGVCKTDGRFSQSRLVSQRRNTDYRYCVYRFDTRDKGTYYGVVTYMYFDIPLIGGTLEFPVYGETKTLGLLG